MSEDNSFLLEMREIAEEYVQYRRQSMGREEAIAAIKAAYGIEKCGDDDRAVIMMGLTRALCKKKELTDQVAADTLAALASAFFPESPELLRTTEKIRAALNEEALYGPEKVYRPSRRYVPDWKVGDTFAREITNQSAVCQGYSGWSLLLYKADEHRDRWGELRQLLYASLCPPGQEPTCGEELQALGFVRMMPGCSGNWDYLLQLTLTGKRHEASFQLRKLGNFPNVIPPTDRTEENPLVSYPLFDAPSCDGSICSRFRQYGTSHTKAPAARQSPCTRERVMDILIRELGQYEEEVGRQKK